MTARDYLADALREQVPGVTYETAEDRMTRSIQLRLSLKVDRSQLLSEEAVAHHGGDFMAATLRTMIDDLRREVIHAAGLQSVIDAEAAKVRAKCLRAVERLQAAEVATNEEAAAFAGLDEGHTHAALLGKSAGIRAAALILADALGDEVTR